MKKELAELQEELAEAHTQVRETSINMCTLDLHLSEMKCLFLHWNVLYINSREALPLNNYCFTSHIRGSDMNHFVLLENWAKKYSARTFYLLENTVVLILWFTFTLWQLILSTINKATSITDSTKQQVHISEARVEAALDKLAYMEAVVNDRLLQERTTTEANCASPSPSSSSELGPVKSKLPRRSLNVSGPVQPYNERLKNFWYPVAFSTDLKDETMVSDFSNNILKLIV